VPRPLERESSFSSGESDVKFKEGDRVVTCGQVQGFHRDGFFYATKVYEAKVRKRDGGSHLEARPKAQ